MSSTKISYFMPDVLNSLLYFGMELGESKTSTVPVNLLTLHTSNLIKIT